MSEQAFNSGIRWLRPAVLLMFLMGVAAPPTPARSGEEVFVSIGTGERDGVYYPVGKAICEMVNQNLRTHEVRCSPETTPGSVYNIDALHSGELEFAIVQSDVLFAAYNGEGTWLRHPHHDLRSVVSLYPELVTVIARVGSPIHDLASLAGRRVNIGRRGSGTRTTWDIIQAELGWRNWERVNAVELRGDATQSALCNGTIDASVMIVGHPSPAVTAQQTACAINFVPVAGTAIDKLVHDRPYYQRGAIGGTAYGLTAEVPTFGVRATLVTSASVDARVVAVITKEILAHLTELGAMQPTLAGLSSNEMIKDRPIVPLHPGAVQIYKEGEQKAE